MFLNYEVKLRMINNVAKPNLISFLNNEAPHRV